MGVARRLFGKAVLYPFFASPKKVTQKRVGALLRRNKTLPFGVGALLQRSESDASFGKRNQLAALKHVSLLYPNDAQLSRQPLKRKTATHGMQPEESQLTPPAFVGTTS